MKKNIFLIIVFFMFGADIKSLTYGGCEYSQISKLKSLVSNINITYDYYIENNEAYFNMKVTNLVSDMYFKDSNSNKIYKYSDSVNGEIIIYGIKNTKGNLKFYSARNECYGVNLGSRYYNFPEYNKYYTDPLCVQNPTYSICKKWVKVNYSYSEFKEAIEKYQMSKEENDDIKVRYEKTFLDLLMEFYLKYYYIILPVIILLSALIMFINRKKNSFKL